ncbi:MAG: hypothetical protein AB7U78_24930, partial [Hyphomicrobiaceae bacterium]
MTSPNGAVIDSASNITLTTDSLPNRLARLGDLFAGGGRTLPLTRVGGRVSVVTASHVRGSGRSTSVSLGRVVEVEAGDHRGLG